MSDLARVSGARPTIELDGRTYLVKGDIEVYGQMEQRIIQVRGNPFDMLTGIIQSFAMSDDDEASLKRVTKALVEQCKSWRFVKYGDYMDYVKTPDGLAFQCWLCIKDNDPSLTFESVRAKILRQIQIDEGWTVKFLNALSQASGTDQLGNSTGLPERQAQESGDSSTGT